MSMKIQINETTGSVAVGSTSARISRMPFSRQGRPGKGRLARKKRGEWRELTVAAHPWKKAEGLSAYQVANAYMACESIAFFGGFREEAITLAVQKAIFTIERTVTLEEELALMEKAENFFDAWKEATLQDLVARAVTTLNDRMELVVREVHALSEGFESDFDLALAPALLLQDGAVHYNENYAFVLEAVDPDPGVAILRCLSLFGDDPEVVCEDEEESINKIAEHLKASL